MLENDKCKILWDFTIQIDMKIVHQRSDIVAIDKENSECRIIDIAIPGDQNIKEKELEKINQYQDFRLKVQKLLIVKATVISVVVGALGTVIEELENHLKTIGVRIIIGCLQITNIDNNNSNNNNNNNNNNNSNGGDV